MNIHEHQAKKILKKYGAVVPEGIFALTVEDLVEKAKSLNTKKYVLKAQIHAGGRGKAGGVKILDTIEELEETAKELMGKTLITHQTGPEGREVKRLYVEESSNIDKEFYLSCLVDRASSKIAFISSDQGGMDIEEVANSSPEKIITTKVEIGDEISDQDCEEIIKIFNLKDSAKIQAKSLIKSIYKMFVSTDANMVEVNPLILTKEDKIICLDAKVNFDSNALFRHPEIVELRDLTTDFTTPATGEVLVQTIPASEFSIGPVGLPRTQVNMAFGDAAAALGLPLDPETGYNPGDIFIVKLELVLTDGRMFGASSAAGIITGGYFSSPFQYNALLTCSPMAGDYTINMFDSYGDGWQTTSGGDGGEGLTIDMDGVVTSVAMCSQWGSYDFECTPTNDGYTATATVNIPSGTQSAIWNFPGDYYGEISVQIVAPNGVIAYESETGGTITGLLPIAICQQ